MENQIENYLKAIEAKESTFEYVDACEQSSKVLVITDTCVERIDLDDMTKFNVYYEENDEGGEYEIHIKGKYTNNRIDLTNRNVVVKLVEILIKDLKKEKKINEIQVVVPDDF